MKKLFWKTYQATFTTEDGKLYNKHWFRGRTWEVVQMAISEAGKKSEKEGKKWVLTDLSRI